MTFKYKLKPDHNIPNKPDLYEGDRLVGFWSGGIYRPWAINLGAHISPITLGRMLNWMENLKNDNT